MTSSAAFKRSSTSMLQDLDNRFNLNSIRLGDMIPIIDGGTRGSLRYGPDVLAQPDIVNAANKIIARSLIFISENFLRF